MDNPDSQKLVGKTAIILDGLLALVFFVVVAHLMRPFVPMQGPGVVEFWAAFTAIPMTGVFWILIQMFRVTLTDQLRRKKQPSEH